jgi:hypothetical protein
MERIVINCLVGIDVGYCYDYVADRTFTIEAIPYAGRRRAV